MCLCDVCMNIGEREGWGKERKTKRERREEGERERKREKERERERDSLTHLFICFIFPCKAWTGIPGRSFEKRSFKKDTEMMGVRRRERE